MKKLLIGLLALLSIDAGAVGTVNESQIIPGISASRNYVKNPSARKNTLNTSTSSAVVTRVTTAGYKLDGFASYTCNASATSGYCEFTLDTIETPDDSGDCEFKGRFAGDGSLYSAQVLDGSSNVLNSVALTSVSTTWTPFSINYPCGSSRKVRITQTTAGTSPDVYVGSLYYGRSTNTGNSSPPTEWRNNLTFTVNGFGTVTSPNYWWRRVGDSMQIRGTWVNGTVAASTGYIQLPSGYALDTSKFSSEVGSQSVGVFYLRKTGSAALYSAGLDGLLFYDGSTNNQLFMAQTEGASANQFTKANGSTLSATGAAHSFEMTVPIAGWSASEQSVRPDQANYDWTSYTPTFTGIGTVTSPSCFHKREGSDMLIQCKFVAGTSTATEARVSLPNSLTVDSVKNPSIRIVGYMGSDTFFGTFRYMMLAEPSVSYLTFSKASASNADLTKQNGNGIFTSGEIWNFNARVPIQGWIQTNSAPLLVGSITSNTSSAIRFESAYITNSGTPTVSDEGGTDWLGTAPDTGVGTSAIPINAGVFSATPHCWCVAYQGGARSCVISSDTAISTTVVRPLTSITSTGAASDENFWLFCKGPR